MIPRSRAIGLIFASGIVVITLAAALRAVTYTRPDAIDWVRGEAARDFESYYDARFPVKTFGTNLWAWFGYLLFNEGRPGVVIGADDWLYTAEELNATDQAEALRDAHLNEIVTLARTLQARGITLTVALLPAKARVYAEHLGERQPALLHRDLYPVALARLRAAGLTVPDLAAAFTACKAGGAVFLRTDTHWTPYGANCAAAALMGAVVPPMRTLAESAEPAAASRVHRGDLFNYLPLDPYFDAWLPAPDRLAVVAEKPASAAGAAALLFDAPAPETVLVGSSYSADARWGFEAALRAASGQDILNLAASGVGPFAPMRAWLDDPSEAPAVRHIIWEIPERYLLLPDVPASGAPRPTP